MESNNKITYPMRCELCGAPPEPEKSQPYKDYTVYKKLCSCGGTIRIELWNPQGKEVVT